MADMHEEIPVSKRDLGELLLSSVRYALGRYTGISSDTRRWIERYAPHIEPAYRAMCARDIRRQLEREGYDKPDIRAVLGAKPEYAASWPDWEAALKVLEADE